MKMLRNTAHETVGDALRAALAPSAEARLLTTELSLFGWAALRTELGALGAVRLLLGGQAAPGAWADGTDAWLLGGRDERGLRQTWHLPALARELSAWIERALVRGALAPQAQCVYHLRRPDGHTTALCGSVPLTGTGLGLAATVTPHFGHQSDEPGFATPLLDLFEQTWHHGAQDVRAAVQARLAQLATPRPAADFYHAVLLRLLREQVEVPAEGTSSADPAGRHGGDAPHAGTGLYASEVWRRLYRFQRDGVLGVIAKLDAHQGCILADSVGLGKTFEALAVIKRFELRNQRVLVLAPKRLRENWTLYAANDRRNPLAADRFQYDVLHHTDLSRTRGTSGSLDLAGLNWGNYDLVVIDESHNFRNNPARRTGRTRYQRLMEDIIQSGVRTRVLMLSATPVNSRLADLKNQVAFITEGRDDALAAVGLPSIEGTLRRAQAAFNGWQREPTAHRSTRSLLDALNADYFHLLDTLTIARSRKHIVRYYGTDEMGRFPHRRPPLNLKPRIDAAGELPAIKDLNRDIQRLNLSAYAPLRYVLADRVAHYAARYDLQMQGGRSFRQSDREESLIHLMRVNLLKRLESSIYAFAGTLSALLGKVEALAERLTQHEARGAGAAGPNGASAAGPDEAGPQDRELEAPDLAGLDLDAEDAADDLVGTKVKVHLDDVDRLRWQQDLSEDAALLRRLRDAARAVDADRDLKLTALREHLAHKAAHPHNPGNRKALVFTAFADTAEYLYTHLAPWAQAHLGLHSALVTGRSQRNRTTLPGLRTDLVSVLTAFSPVSKERATLDPEAEGAVDLLFATDCISEGQNLQDCDHLINYDIHWNPVRIIQRFGRIDRLGSRNTSIQLVNFWPDLNLDEYINLEARVAGRMMLLDVSATGEENVIEHTGAEQMNDLAYRRRQLERLTTEVVDLEDLGEGIAITDLTFNDFRLDRGRLSAADRLALAALPPGFTATVALPPAAGAPAAPAGQSAPATHEAAPGDASATEASASDPAPADTTAPDDAASPLSGLDLAPGTVFLLRHDPKLPAAAFGAAPSAEPAPARPGGLDDPFAPWYLVYVDAHARVRQGPAQTRTLLGLLKAMAQHDAAPPRPRLPRSGRRTEADLAQLQAAVAAVTGTVEAQGFDSLFSRAGTTVGAHRTAGLDDFEVMARLDLHAAE